MKFIKNKIKFKNNSKGFSILELLLYVVIASTMLLVISTFMNTLVESRVKNTTINEVEAQGAKLMDYMLESIRNSEAVNSPAAGASAASISLQKETGAVDPTVFSLLSGVLHITEGVGTPVALNNSEIQITSLNFENLAKTGTSDTVRVSFTVSYDSSSTHHEFNYSRTFYGSATIRE